MLIDCKLLLYPLPRHQLLLLYTHSVNQHYHYTASQPSKQMLMFPDICFSPFLFSNSKKASSLKIFYTECHTMQCSASLIVFKTWLWWTHSGLGGGGCKTLPLFFRLGVGVCSSTGILCHHSQYRCPHMWVTLGSPGHLDMSRVTQTPGRAQQSGSVHWEPSTVIIHHGS